MNNRADAVGGAIRVRPIATQLGEGITFVLRDSQFNVNTAGFLGGAIAVGLRSNNEMSGSVFISNSVTEAATEFTSGGAVSIFGAQAVSKNNKFERNVAGTAGGAVDIFRAGARTARTRAPRRAPPLLALGGLDQAGAVPRSGKRLAAASAA